MLHFYQWDTKQQVKAPDGVETIHFRIDNDHAAPVTVVNGWATVPDECFQSGDNLVYYAYDENHTTDSARVEVVERPKPAGYIYTPTEIKTWEQLDARIKKLEHGGGVVDATLTQSGQAADAKVTGQKIGQLKEVIEDTGIYKKEDLPAYMGGIAANKGNYVSQIQYLDLKNRLRTINRITSFKEAFLLKAGKKYLVTVNDGYMYALQLFDSIGGAALLDFKYRSDDYKIEYDRDVYAAFMLKKIDESDMNVSEMSNVSLVQYDNIGEQLNVANKRETIDLPFDENKIEATIYKDNNGYYTDFNVKNAS